MVRVSFLNESLWLRHKDFLRNKAMEEGIIGIKLSQRPTTSDGKRENTSRYFLFYDMAKCINVFVLMEILVN